MKLGTPEILLIFSKNEPLGITEILSDVVSKTRHYGFPKFFQILPKKKHQGAPRFLQNLAKKYPGVLGDYLNFSKNKTLGSANFSEMIKKKSHQSSRR